MNVQCLLFCGNDTLPGILRNAEPARLATELRNSGFETICVDIGGLTKKHISTIDKIINKYSIRRNYMILAKRAFRRPSSSIPWHSDILDRSEFIKRYNELYLPHLIVGKKNFDDPFVAKFLSVWDTWETHINYRSDEILQKFWTLRDQYNQENGIVVEFAIVEEINDVQLAVF